LQFEPTIAAVETQLEIIKSLNEKIISLADAESTPDELLDSQMYVFDTEAKIRRYRQHLRDHPSSSRAAVHERSHPSSELQPPAISEASTHYLEDQEYMFFPGKNVNQSSLPEEAFQQSATEAELAHLCGDFLTWQAF